MPDYSGPERRRFVPCPMHDTLVSDIRDDFDRGDKRMDRIESKVDIILGKQAEQALAIQELKDKIGNGLTSDIKRTAETMAEIKTVMKDVCQRYEAQLQSHELTLSEFKWFRDFMNKLRNHVIFKILTIAIFGGLVAGIFILIERSR